MTDVCCRRGEQERGREVEGMGEFKDVLGEVVAACAPKISAMAALLSSKNARPRSSACGRCTRG